MYTTVVAMHRSITIISTVLSHHSFNVTAQTTRHRVTTPLFDRWPNSAKVIFNFAQ